MPNFRRNIIISFLVLILPSTSYASKPQWDAEGIVTMRDNQPCFSYPQDKEIRKRPYSFYDLAVSKAGPQGGGMWYVDIISIDRKGLKDPNTLETCVKYGVLNLGMKVKQNAERLKMNTPYEVSIGVSTSGASTSDYIYQRNYRSYFCLSRNPKGEVVLTGVDWEHTQYEPHCLKPGESPKRSFWQKLFGN